MREAAYDGLHIWYKEYHDKLNEVIKDGETQIDKLIMTISSGAIILSVNFYKDIISKFTPWVSILLESSWLFFLSSIIAVVSSYRLSIYDFSRTKNEL